MLAPAYPLGLTWIEDHNFDQLIAQARLAPLELVADFARTTSQWARLAHRAGYNLTDLRVAVRLAAIPTHAAAAELHARLHDDPAAVIGLHALGPALESLAATHAALTPNASFGYPEAYVPLALGPQDIASTAAILKQSTLSPPSRGRQAWRPAAHRRQWCSGEHPVAADVVLERRQDHVAIAHLGT